VPPVTQSSLEQRIIQAAEHALKAHGYVATIDVLGGIGWLHYSGVESWRQGRIEYLEELIQARPDNLSAAKRILHEWVLDRGLKPVETGYVARSRARGPLRFTRDGDPAEERAYRTHWVSSDLTDNQRARLTACQSKAPDLVVISPLKEWTCNSCGGTGSWLIMEGDGPLCMSCSDMDHLVFLPSGDAALTRRAKRASRLSAVVVRFSRARRRYERQGLLVEESALDQAEAECLADEDARARRREREAIRRAEQDLELQSRMATKILQLFPGCPPERAQEIARHAATRGSGRVGRSAAGRALDDRALELAVAAAVRHRDTRYDELLMTGVDREDARDAVRDDVARILAAWRTDSG
jgi:hypothetical protein